MLTRLRHFLRRVFRRRPSPARGPAPMPADRAPANCDSQASEPPSPTPDARTSSRELMTRAAQAAQDHRGESFPVMMWGEADAPTRSDRAGEEGAEPRVDDEGDSPVTSIEEEEQVTEVGNRELRAPVEEGAQVAEVEDRGPLTPIKEVEEEE